MLSHDRSIKQYAPSIDAYCIRAALFTLSVACAALLLVRVPQWSEKYSLPAAVGLAAVLTALVLALAYIAVQAPSVVTRRILSEIVVLGIALLALEIALTASIPHRLDEQGQRRRAAVKINLPFDSRSTSEVVRDLRREGVDALPGLSGSWAQLPTVRPYLPNGLYPLSHASNAVIVQCNESGRYLLYRSDDWGFNNPPGLLNSRDIDVALVGESYMLGNCLPAELSLPGRIRKRYPQMANFAMAGNRTLSTLGGFREYVEPLKPRIVLWAVNPGSVVNVEELNDPLLMRYLEPAFSQHLIARQEEIDQLVRTLAITSKADGDRQWQAELRQLQIERWKSVWQLLETRARIRQFLTRKRPPEKGPDLTVFLRALDLARHTTEGWGGRFIVVLMPIYEEVVADQIKGNLRHHHLARSLREIGITVVDGVALFKKQPDPKGLFTLRMKNHPTAQAYVLLSEHILAEVEAQSRVAVAVR